MAEDIINMTQKELKRLHVIRKVVEGQMKQAEAGGMLSLSLRQVRRIVRRIRIEGDSGIAYKSRGRASNRRVPAGVREKAIGLYREKYKGFGPLLASEKLSELDGIEVSDETLRKWLMDAGEWRKGRRGLVHRRWRERKEYFGEMVQMDGSHHDWLEGRGPELIFMGYIDDATNNMYGRFYDYEGTMPAMDSFKRYARKYGLPMSIYQDRHTTYKSTRKLTPEEELEGMEEPMSQFERALKELGVKVIHATSPQAKGRIERSFRTLQDRLVKEMRLAGIKTKDEANEFLKGYLPVHNRRFGVVPAKKGDIHRPVPVGLDLNKVLCIRTKRALRNDFTIAHDRRLYQILDCVRAKDVIVEERTDGKMLIKYNGRALRFKEITTRPPEEKPLKPFKIRKKYVPPKDHPWRRYSPIAQKEDISILAKIGHF